MKLKPGRRIQGLIRILTHDLCDTGAVLYQLSYRAFWELINMWIRNIPVDHEEYLTNRFHVAVRLFSNRSQMTSKCGKNKKVAHEAIAECVTDVIFCLWVCHWCSLLSIQNETISLVAMRSKELWLVQENHATLTLDFSVASRGMKTYSESRIELRNLKISRKYWTSQVSFCHQSSPVSRKAWTLPRKLQELN